MSQLRSWTAWLPTGMAALLLGGAGYWLGQMLPAVSRPQPVAEAPVASGAAGKSCDAPPIITPPASTLALPVSAELPTAWATEAAQPATERYTMQATTRRYVGTVGGQMTTVALTWVRPDSAVGRFYYWQQATEYELTTSSRQRPGRLLVHRAGNGGFFSEPGERIPGYWQLTSIPGAQLRGYWRGPAGQQPFVLQESYQSSVRYAIGSLNITGPNAGDADQRPRHESDFLRLLGGPGAGGVLARQLCPSRAQQRTIVLDNEGQAYCGSKIDVRLNDFYLLSFYRHDIIDPIEGTNDLMLDAWLFDLASGRELTVASQLQPHYEKPLRRLLTQQLLRNPRFNYLDPKLNPSAPAAWRWHDEQGQPATLVSLPAEGEPLALTATGLEATYNSNTLFDNGGTFSFYPLYPVLIPYRELRPLVRPSTPLARMLAARGMW